ncbi:vacuolar protein sorting-associated protein 72 homolog isoform X1 [Neomonachus schauinslandi]|uniref:Vacuolar protein sorting-associated protein 72 homolog n=2 Tax=Pinnipedia TaxID=3072905 RepID=A0A8M1MC30_NEOSC|nr:vacuolar protein sorting-associated protein 72 homolog isoform X1 [Neomonachus schauinslandi]
MSLAGGRAPRKTAGNRLSGLLEAEEEDEFYQTTYGGFTEESGDDEYQGDQSDTEDEVDSDFDIDEGDEPSSDGEAEEPRRKRRVVTKAYKEPLKSLRPRKVSTPAGSSQKAREEKALLPLELQDDGSDSRKSMRQSTAEHTRQTFLRVQERQGQSRRRKGPHCERPLTQEELLREAKITEELNLRSLETYERLEADKKKQVHKKRKCPGPIITYHSVTVPLVGEPGPKEENVDVEGGFCVFLSLSPLRLDPTPTASALTPHAGTGPVVPPARCSRTFITFSDDATFEEWFPQGRPPKVPVREVCPVTHRPALYRDPVTDIPYATARAFKIIREAYKKYITAHGLPPTASALGPGPPPPEPLPGSGPRALRQKIVIK